MRATLGAALTGIALVTAGSAAGQPAPPLGGVALPVWRVGDEWSYRWESPRGKGTFTWVVDREAVVDGVTYYVTKGGGREHLWRKSDLGFHLQTLESGLEERAVPPRSDYAWPLAVGKTWEYTYTRERPLDRQTVEFTITSRVEAEETVSVPGGTFKTLKVVHRNKRTGAITSEWWYAPEVRSWVRMKIRAVYGIIDRELTAFKPSGAPVPAGAAVAPRPPSPPDPVPRDPKATARGEFSHRVTYRISGTAGEAKITYRNERGGTQQTTGRLPWELAFDARAGHFLYVSAQNQDATGSIACDIVIDGVSRTTATSTGAYVVAECSEAAEP